jgi:hypothetical protein
MSSWAMPAQSVEGTGARFQIDTDGQPASQHGGPHDYYVVSSVFVTQQRGCYCNPLLDLDFRSEVQSRCASRPGHLCDSSHGYSLIWTVV